jgi:hypothetical protein
MTAIVNTDTTTTTTTTTLYGPDVSRDKFIQSQPQRVESLLQDVHFFSDDGYLNLWEIVQELEQHGYLLALSDVSVKFHDMSFGWVLATPIGKRLAAAAGFCNGTGNSLWAEGAGMQSVTLFITLNKHYLKAEFPLIPTFSITCAIPRHSPKFFEILKILLKYYHIMMTMGMY